MQIEQDSLTLEGQIENLLEQFTQNSYEKNEIIAVDVNIPIKIRQHNMTTNSLDSQIEKLIENKENQSLMKLLLQQKNLISESSLLKIIKSISYQYEKQDKSLTELKICKEFKELNKQLKDFVNSCAKDEFKKFFATKRVKHALLFMIHCFSIPFTDQKLVQELKYLTVNDLTFITEILIFLFYFNNSNTKSLEFIDNSKIIKWFSLLLDAHFIDYCINNELQHLAELIQTIINEEKSLIQIEQYLDNAIELSKSGIPQELMKNSKQSSNLVTLGVLYF